MAEAGRGRIVAGAVTGALLVGLVGVPIVGLGQVAFEDGPAAFAAALGGPLAATAVLDSLWTSAVVAVIAVTAGTAAAIVTERLAGRSRALLRAGVLTPLVVPPFVLAFGWTRAFGPRGLTDQVIGVALPGLYGPLGIVLVVGLAATPLAWLIVAAALATRVEPELELAARTSGAGRVDALRTVTLPLLRPAILSAFVVTFVFGINAFGVPAILGTPAGFETITTRLYADLARSADPAAFARAAALATTLVVLAVIVVGSADALLTGRAASRTGQPTGLAPAAGSSRWPAVALGAGLLVTVGLPLVAIVLTALTRAVGLAPVPADWTLDNLRAAVGDSRFVPALVTSLVLSASAATLVVGLAALVAAGLRGRAARIAGTGVALGFAIPGSALAVALLLTYGGAIGDTLGIILLAYVAKFWALGHRQLAGSLDRLPTEAVRAARVSGAGLVTTIRTVAAPMLRPSIVAAWVVVLVFGLHELTMSALLYGPGTATLAVHVLNVEQLGDPTVTAALAIVLTVIVGLAALPLVVLGRGPGARRRASAP